MIIREDDLQGPEIAKLLDDHLEFTAGQSPPESMHALDLDGLRAPGTTFWTAWEGPGLLGCGALKVLDPSHGEIKSMQANAAVTPAMIAVFLEFIVTFSLFKCEAEPGPYVSLGIAAPAPVGGVLNDSNTRQIPVQKTLVDSSA